MLGQVIGGKARGVVLLQEAQAALVELVEGDALAPVEMVEDAQVHQSTVQASWKSRRGNFTMTLDGSPWPTLQRKLDFTRPSGKNSASTFALSKPDMPPTSRPTARAASMKYAPCRVPLRKATISVGAASLA